jgi:DNA-binding NarL/FixJ family response regulator
MLVVETIARIRREHFIKGKTIKEIARDLKVSRNTVRKVLRSGGDLLRVRAIGAATAKAGAMGVGA